MDVFGSEVDHDRAAFIHPSVQLYGKVTLAEGTSLWPNTVIRAEMYLPVTGDFSMVGSRGEPLWQRRFS